MSVVTDRARYAAELLILCVGPWLAGLFPEGRGLLAVRRQVQFWFPIRHGYEQLRDMPVTRGSRFIIDRHPGHDAVLIVSPCSGHGFKHSPAIGEAVAQWVTNGTPDVDVRPFRLPHALR